MNENIIKWKIFQKYNIKVIDTINTCSNLIFYNLQRGNKSFNIFIYDRVIRLATLPVATSNMPYYCWLHIRIKIN